MIMQVNSIGIRKYRERTSVVSSSSANIAAQKVLIRDIVTFVRAHQQVGTIEDYIAKIQLGVISKLSRTTDLHSSSGGAEMLRLGAVATCASYENNRQL